MGSTQTHNHRHTRIISSRPTPPDTPITPSSHQHLHRSIPPSLPTRPCPASRYRSRIRPSLASVRLSHPPVSPCARHRPYPPYPPYPHGPASRRTNGGRGERRTPRTLDPSRTRVRGVWVAPCCLFSRSDPRS